MGGLLVVLTIHFPPSIEKNAERCYTVSDFEMAQWMQIEKRLDGTKRDHGVTTK